MASVLFLCYTKLKIIYIIRIGTLMEASMKAKGFIKFQFDRLISIILVEEKNLFLRLFHDKSI